MKPPTWSAPTRRRVFLESRDSAGGAEPAWASVRNSVASQPIAIESPNRMISTSTPRVAMRNHQNSRSIVGIFSSRYDSSQTANHRCASSSDTSDPIEFAKTVPRRAKTRFALGRRMYTLDPIEAISAATVRAATTLEPWSSALAPRNAATRDDAARSVPVRFRSSSRTRSCCSSPFSENSMQSLRFRPPIHGGETCRRRASYSATALRPAASRRCSSGPCASAAA